MATSILEKDDTFWKVCEKGDGRMTRFVGESLAMCERNDDFFAWNINHQLVPIPDYC